MDSKEHIIDNSNLKKTLELNKFFTNKKMVLTFFLIFLAGIALAFIEVFFLYIFKK